MRPESPPNTYVTYLDASQRYFGTIEVGQLGVRAGKVVKKLGEEEFRQKLAEFHKLEALLNGLATSGATLDDGIYHELLQLAGELLLERRGDRFSW